MNIIQALEQEQLRNDIPKFIPGDSVRVHVKVVEGSNERIQMFEGVVIARQGSVLSWYWLSVSAVWLLPGDQASGDVGCADGDLAGAPCSAGLCSFCCDW